MNPFDLMKNLKNLQSQMSTMKEEIKTITATGSAGGNMVQVTLNGEFEMTSIKIDPIAVDPRDVNMRQDLIVAASHNASEKIKEAIASKAGPMLGGMGLDMSNMPNL